MTTARTHLAALSVGAALLLAAGCGSDDEKGEPLPSAAVAELDRRLNEVEIRYRDGIENNNPGACNDIESDSYKVIDRTVADLPEDVDEDVRDALEDGLARLKELTSDGCSEVKPARTEPEETTPPPETVPPPPVTETPPPPPETQTKPEQKPKDEKEKDGNRNGNGNDNGQLPGGTEVPGDTGGATPGAPEE